MCQIPIINIGEQEYVDELTHNVFTTGGESIICRSPISKTLDKFFVSPDTRKPILMSQNKLNKIKRLYSLRLQNTVIPIALICAAGKLVGYRIPYYESYVPLEDAILSRKQKIAAIKKSAQILQNFTEHDITYGDVKGDNILFNPNNSNIIFCDMDNVRIGKYPPDLKGRSLTIYYEITGKVDAKADAYMHNLFTMQQLGYSEVPEYYNEVLVDIRKENYPAGFQARGQQVMQSMLNPKKFTGEYIVQYVKR